MTREMVHECVSNNRLGLNIFLLSLRIGFVREGEREREKRDQMIIKNSLVKVGWVFYFVLIFPQPLIVP